MSCRNCTCERCQRVYATRRRHAAQAVELREQGITLPRIAEMIGTSKDVVSRLLKEAKQ